MTVPEKWNSLTVSLAITKQGLNAASVSEALGVHGGPSEDGPVVHSGPHWWSYTCEERPGDDHNEVVTALVDHVRNRLEKVEALRMTGHFVEVAVAGTVETNAELCLSPRALGALASLALPVSFTSLTSQQDQEEDPLSWLDG
ncbi:hypothetical protein [Streptomyces sp. NPDC006307]|uniref:hypothetical protein n=1 Tax=Streptomyces sp. NPDC006307 TaxID=3156748 RepID=UPI0033B23E0F